MRKISRFIITFIIKWKYMEYNNIQEDSICVKKEGKYMYFVYALLSLDVCTRTWFSLFPRIQGD